MIAYHRKSNVDREPVEERMSCEVVVSGKKTIECRVLEFPRRRGVAPISI